MVSGSLHNERKAARFPLWANQITELFVGDPSDRKFGIYKYS